MTSTIRGTSTDKYVAALVDLVPVLPLWSHIFSVCLRTAVPLVGAISELQYFIFHCLHILVLLRWVCSTQHMIFSP